MPFGSDLLFAAADVDGLVVHVEVCEDMFVPIPPSAEAALAGATVLANLSGSPITVGRADDRQLLARSASARCSAAYVYAAAGDGESTTEVSWDGQTSIHENGALLAETERFPAGERHAVADVDLRPAALRAPADGHVRRQPPPPRSRRPRTTFRTVEFTLDPPTGDLGFRRDVERFPFVPTDPARLEQDCYEAYNIQVAGLLQRLRAIGDAKVVIGVSGRTRLHPRADRGRPRHGPRRPPALGHPRLHAARLRDGRAHEVQRAAPRRRPSGSRSRRSTSPRPPG